MTTAGSRDCTNCFFKPTTALIRCGHKICKSHSESLQRQLQTDKKTPCGFCGKPVLTPYNQLSNQPEQYPVSADLARARFGPSLTFPTSRPSSATISSSTSTSTSVSSSSHPYPYPSKLDTFTTESLHRSNRDTATMSTIYDNTRRFNTRTSYEDLADTVNMTDARVDTSPSVHELTSMLHSHRLSDPFVNCSDAASPLSQRSYSRSSTRLSMSSYPASINSAMYNGIGTAMMRLPGDDDHRRNASALASLIKSGGMTGPGSYQTDNSSRRRTDSLGSSQTGRSLSGPIAIAPVVNHWNVHMIDTIPNPPFFEAAKNGVAPAIEQALEHVPFTEPAVHRKPIQTGVVYVRNIPYSTNKNEIIAAVGRNARLVSQPAGTSYNSIHIIMERSTGKTMDAFVEVADPNSAASIVSGFTLRRDQRRGPRIGDRAVDIELSTQEELMKALFPRAKCVEWVGQQPRISQSDDEYESGFLGFLTGEEMTMMVKHAEIPHRSPYASRCLNRVYECMISTLHKYPWAATTAVSLKERALLLDSTLILLRCLIRALRTGGSRRDRDEITPQLSVELLQELLCAALTVPFSCKQKAEIVTIMEENGCGALVGSVGYSGVGALTPFWPFESIDRKPGVSAEVVEYYAHLLSLAPSPSRRAVASPFGAFGVDVHRAADVTLAEAAYVEWNAIETALRKVLEYMPSAPSVVSVGPVGRGVDATTGAQSQAQVQASGTASSASTTGGVLLPKNDDKENDKFVFKGLGAGLTTRARGQTLLDPTAAEFPSSRQQDAGSKVGKSWADAAKGV